MPVFGAAYLLALLGMTLTRVPRAVWPLALSLLFSLVAFCLYAWDKRAAKRRARRVPEATLHTIALLGGWPGAALAQTAFRHKTQKPSFRRGFVATVFLNLLLVAAFLYFVRG